MITLDILCLVTPRPITTSTTLSVTTGSTSKEMSNFKLIPFDMDGNLIMEGNDLETWTARNDNIRLEGIWSKNCNVKHLSKEKNYKILTNYNNRGRGGGSSKLIATVQSAPEIFVIPLSKSTTCAFDIRAALKAGVESESLLKSFGSGTRGREVINKGIPTTSVISKTQTTNGPSHFGSGTLNGAESYDHLGKACANVNTTKRDKTKNLRRSQQIALESPQILVIPSPTASSIVDICTPEKITGDTKKFHPQCEQDFKESRINFKKCGKQSSDLFDHKVAAQRNTFIGFEKSEVDNKYHQVKRVVQQTPVSEICINCQYNFIYLCNFHDCICKTNTTTPTKHSVDILKSFATKIENILFDKKVALPIGGENLLNCWRSSKPRNINILQKYCYLANIYNKDTTKKAVEILTNLNNYELQNTSYLKLNSDECSVPDGIIIIRNSLIICLKNLYFAAQERKAYLSSCLKSKIVHVKLTFEKELLYPDGKLIQGFIKKNFEHTNKKNSGSRPYLAVNNIITLLKIEEFEASNRLKRLQQHFRSLFCMSRRNLHNIIRISETSLKSTEQSVSAEDVVLLLQFRNKICGPNGLKNFRDGSTLIFEKYCNLKDITYTARDRKISAIATTSISIWYGFDENLRTEGKHWNREKKEKEDKESFKNPELFNALAYNYSLDSSTSKLTTKLVRVSATKKGKTTSNTSAISIKGPLIDSLAINKQKIWLSLENTKKEHIKYLINSGPNLNANSSKRGKVHTPPFYLSPNATDNFSTPLKNCKKWFQSVTKTNQILRSQRDESVSTRSPAVLVPTLARDSAFAPTKTGKNIYFSKDLFLVAPFSEFNARYLSEFVNVEDSTQFSDVYQNFVTLDSSKDPTEEVFECYDELLEEEFDVESECRCEHCIPGFHSLNNPVLIITSNTCLHAPGVRLSKGTSSCSEKCATILTTAAKADKMREVNNGQLRGLLKKPNRPPPTRKNRVVFDETRNEFFEADYIILIREDCSYDEEDEEPCACGEHELVRLCCDEGCQCNYALIEDNRTPQSPKFAPPMEFIDEAALSPPDGYKDNGVKDTLGGTLGGHIFGAQHIQQLQVIQRLQQQRAAMLAARSSNNQITPQPPLVENLPKNEQQSQEQHLFPKSAANSQKITSSQPQPLSDDDPQAVCTECAECAECAAKQLEDAGCTSSQCREEILQLAVPAVTLLPLHTSSPERRITQKEIIAGEERPKYLIPCIPLPERRTVREATEDVQTQKAEEMKANELLPSSLPAKLVAVLSNQPNNVPKNYEEQKPPPIPPKESSPTQINGILKGGKLWKQDSVTQSDDQSNTTSDDEGNSVKRSVRFFTEVTGNSENDVTVPNSTNAAEGDTQINELIPIRKHSTLFNNALRPNSAVRQLFPSVVQQAPVLTSEILRAFDESKRTGCLVSTLPGSSDSDTLRRSMERNILRRSLTKKKMIKSDISLEERIKQLTCYIDESRDVENGNDSRGKNMDDTELAHGEMPAEVEYQQTCLNGIDKNFSPSSSVSSSSSGSSSAYKKIADIFNRDKKQDKILEVEENPIVIIPQECRCPAAPDLGMGIQVPVVHTQIHRPPPRQLEPKKQFLSTLAPLTACVAGQKDDLSSYYTLAAAHQSGYTASISNCEEYNFGPMDPSVQITEDMRKVAPDVIAGTPGQEQQDELAVFAQQEAIRTEKIKKRYTNEICKINSDDDEQNDYGFNKRPSVRGIKPKFSSTNDILQQMQNQLTQHMPSVSGGKTNNQTIRSYTLPKQPASSAISSMTKHGSHNPSIQNMSQSALVSQQAIPTHEKLHQQHNLDPQQHQQQFLQPQPFQPLTMQTNAIAQQQTEQRTWSFYTEAGEQHIPLENSIQQPECYQTLPSSALFRKSVMNHGQEESHMYGQNGRNITTIEQQYGHYVRSPTRRPESPPPLRNYHQTMVLIPYDAETYSQFSTASVDPKIAHIQRQNILEYQQVTQQTIRVPIGYALPGMQLHVVAGRGQSQAHAQHPQQRIFTPHFQFAQECNLSNIGERRATDGAAVVAHTDCSHLVSPTASGSNHQAHQQQLSPNCNQPTDNSPVGPASLPYSMNV